MASGHFCRTEVYKRPAKLELEENKELDYSDAFGMLFIRA
jgi:hypothetical protein